MPKAPATPKGFHQSKTSTRAQYAILLRKNSKLEVTLNSAIAATTIVYPRSGSANDDHQSIPIATTAENAHSVSKAIRPPVGHEQRRHVAEAVKGGNDNRITLETNEPVVFQVDSTDPSMLKLAITPRQLHLSASTIIQACTVEKEDAPSALRFDISDDPEADDVMGPDGKSGVCRIVYIDSPCSYEFGAFRPVVGEVFILKARRSDVNSRGVMLVHADKLTRGGWLREGEMKDKIMAASNPYHIFRGVIVCIGPQWGPWQGGMNNWGRIAWQMECLNRDKCGCPKEAVYNGDKTGTERELERCEIEVIDLEDTDQLDQESSTSISSALDGDETE